ncbi:ECF transporter S component [Paenibacillus thiaminolyticus]|uniref:ECF transporter S component n=1 Tax=Paenibacillus thiaminolyticus TaxID=49283 RepID=A0AAP9DW78_PANTH|nr:ECF transporter S component [Paenibacillus thiaminolyticus]MCY9535414.1 ECF transporter S component [Paenibacillus thiaminolyticus]MCY9604836.1 ECF transporter S component [Paenibacillus thiaminolyticus]MCY9610023.1 ECF transporter S component [Paenibacillus thiaminolyticus]MCY9615138.1 ECF transporter S component [Paenibacillus thiaminolyticus]MCY9621131.1 ECF transporter S component [Paenibacillus thiaminolyticus]
MMSKRSIWSFSTAALVLIPVAVGINYIGKLFAGVLKLPLWLDAIGTVLASMLAGPVIGGMSGLINNIIYGLTMDPISFVYALTSVFIGLVAGIMAHKGWISSWGKAAVIGLAVGLTAVVISTPLNVAFWGGQTGNVWGDIVFGYVLQGTQSVWLASFLDELVVDLPDKLITVLVAYGIYRVLPNSLMNMYKNSGDIEKL